MFATTFGRAAIRPPSAPQPLRPALRGAAEAVDVAPIAARADRDVSSAGAAGVATGGVQRPPSRSPGRPARLAASSAWTRRRL